MNKNKVGWLIAFLISAILSCWATSSSFMLMMPSIFSSNIIVRTIMVWALVMIIYVLASMALKWAVDARNNRETTSGWKGKFWGSVAVLAVAWLVVSSPTNAHTFFYKLKIGDVVLEDISTTEKYSHQLCERTVVNPEYYIVEAKVDSIFKLFHDEVMGVNGHYGIDNRAQKIFSSLNEVLGSQYSITTPTNCGNNAQLLSNALNQKREELSRQLNRIKQDKYLVDRNLSQEACKDVDNLANMKDTIQNLVYTNQISSSKAEAVITQTDGVLKDAYAHIKNSQQFVDFAEGDSVIYTAPNIETRTSRFLNPYSVAWDYFSGKIPFSFTFWLILSIVIDLAGFFFFYQWQKNDFDF